MRSAAVAGISSIGLTSVAAAKGDSEAGTENTSDTEDENATGDGENATNQQDEEASEEETDQEAAENVQAGITFTDQTTDGDSVVADRVSMPEGGFVSIHDRRRFDGEILPSIIGITDFLEPGEHRNVSVQFFTEDATAPGPLDEGQDGNGLTESQPLIAIPHRDADDSGAFSGEPNPDPAYKGPGVLEELGAVNDIATAFVEGADQEERNEAKEEEREARQQFSG